MKIPFLVFTFYIPVLLQLGPLQPAFVAVFLIPTPATSHRSPARGSVVGPICVDHCPCLNNASRSWLPFPVQCQDLQGGAGRSVGSPGPKSPSLLGCAPTHREKPKGALCSSPIHSRWHSPTVPGPSLLPTFATLLVAGAPGQLWRWWSPKAPARSPIRSALAGVVAAAPTEYGRRGAGRPAGTAGEQGRIPVWAVLSRYPLLPLAFRVTSSPWSKRFFFIPEERCPLGLCLTL